MRTPGSGRKPGTLNKDKLALIEQAAQLGVDPFEFLCLVVKGDWKALGLKEIETNMGSHTVWLPPEVDFDKRFQAAKELCNYLHPKRQSVKVSADEESGFRIVIEDYQSKAKK